MYVGKKHIPDNKNQKDWLHSNSGSMATFCDNRPQTVSQHAIQALGDLSVRSLQTQTLCASLGRLPQQERMLQPVFLHVNPNKSGAVVQCLLDERLIAAMPKGSKLLDSLFPLITEYQTLLGLAESPVPVQNHVELLYKLQSQLLFLLDQAAVPDYYLYPDLVWLRDMLNEVQREHVALMQKADIVFTGIPPIASFDKLPQTEKDELTVLWNRLKTNTGNILIEEPEKAASSLVASSSSSPSSAHSPFYYQVLSLLARLLETTTGKQLIGALDRNEQEKKIHFVPCLARPIDPDTAPGEFVARTNIPADNPADHLSQIMGDKSSINPAEYWEPDPTISSPQSLAAEIYRLHAAEPRWKGVRIGDHYYNFGTGSDVTVTIPTDISDCDKSGQTRMVDAQKLEIPTPNFVTLGHELGHALHIINGSALKDAQLASDFFDLQEIPGFTDYDSNLEEFGNITMVENAIRADLKMRARHGHINRNTILRYSLREVANQLAIIYDIIKSLAYNLSDRMNKCCDLFGSENGIEEGRKELITLLGMWLSQNYKFFSNLSQKEIDDINSEISFSIEVVQTPSRESELPSASAVLNRIGIKLSGKTLVRPVPHASSSPATKAGSGSFFSDLLDYLPWRKK